MSTDEVSSAGPDDEVVVVRAPRQLTEETAHDFRALVAANLPNRDDGGMVIDMTEVYLINSVGITCLLEIREMCQDRRVGLRLCALIEPVEQMLEMLRLSDKFEVSPDLDDAVDALVAGR